MIDEAMIKELESLVRERKGIDRALAYGSFLAEHGVVMSTTDSLDRLHSELAPRAMRQRWGAELCEHLATRKEEINVRLEELLKPRSKAK